MGVFLIIGWGAIIVSPPLTSSLNEIAMLQLAFLYAGLPEEMAKFLLIGVIVMPRNNFRQNGALVAGGLLTGIGFAIPENALYILALGENHFLNAMMRMFLSLNCHLAVGIIMGYHLSILADTKDWKRYYNFLCALFLPVIFHAIYNWAAYYTNIKSASADKWMVFPIVFLFVTSVALAVYLRHIRRIKQAANCKKEINKLRRSILGTAILLYALALAAFATAFGVYYLDISGKWQLTPMMLSSFAIGFFFTGTLIRWSR